MVSRIRSQSRSEIMFDDMSIDKQDRRDEVMVILLQLLKGDVGPTTGVVPMKEPFFRSGSVIGSGRRLVHEDVEDGTGYPGDRLFCNSRAVSHRQTSRKTEPRVILVAAPYGLPIRRLQLKPSILTLSRMFPLVCGATKDFGPFQIGIQRADFG